MRWLRGEAYVPRRQSTRSVDVRRSASADLQRRDPVRQRDVALDERRQGFAEITAGLSEAAALHEARRCLSCGNCFECDNCFAACPETAIVKLGPDARLPVDYAICAPAAPSASSSAHATRWRWCPNLPGHGAADEHAERRWTATRPSRMSRIG